MIIEASLCNEIRYSMHTVMFISALIIQCKLYNQMYMQPALHKKKRKKQATVMKVCLGCIYLVKSTICEKVNCVNSYTVNKADW